MSGPDGRTLGSLKSPLTAACFAAPCVTSPDVDILVHGSNPLLAQLPPSTHKVLRVMMEADAFGIPQQNLNTFEPEGTEVSILLPVMFQTVEPRIFELNPIGDTFVVLHLL